MIGNILNQQYSSMVYWAHQTPVPQMIDTFTYDIYESDNPFRLNYFEEKPINNKYIRTGVNIAQNVGAEVYSAYTNPFYLTHKIVNVPTQYQNVVNHYKKNQVQIFDKK